MSKSKPIRVCIVSPDLLGPVRNGGIGTACTYLAEELSDAGYAVEVLFTQPITSASTDDAWMRRYRKRGIKVTVADAWRSLSTPRVFPCHPLLAMSYVVHDWLAQRHFDLVFFMDWQGNGFYALQAKRTGLRFQDSTFVTVIHSPSMWHAESNADCSTDLLSSLTYFIERKSVKLADAVISPSSYMLAWTRQRGFCPPKRAWILPNLVRIEDKPTRALAAYRVEELVFFGRLEYRKGLVQFCDALDRLTKFGVLPMKVSFLGKFSRIGQEHSGAYIARRSKKWAFAIEIHARHDQPQALAYLKGAGRLAVMPSIADNSPYTIYECLVAGIPFLARNVGGVPELIDSLDQPNVLFDDNPNTLAKRFAHVLKNGTKLARLAFDLNANRLAWRDLVAQLAAKPVPAPRRKPVRPKVSVCLTHYDRPKLLKQAVRSLLAQDYPNFEVILVDDGSTGRAAHVLLDKLESVFAERGWRLVRQANSYLGKARNQAAQLAKGKYLLFMDDDNVAKPHMISSFVRAASFSGADLVTTVFDVFSGERMPTARTPTVERYLPVGDILSFSVVSNAIGDANALMRRDLFKKLGGFSEDYGLGHEDFELFLRAVLSGARVYVSPEPLFWYRRNGASMLSTTHMAANQMRSFRPFLDILPAPLAELAALAYGSTRAQIDPKLASDFRESGVASTEDQQRLLQGDPDSPEIVALLAKVLATQGQSNLGRQLLNSLSAPSSEIDSLKDTATLAAQLLQAATQGCLKTAQRILKNSSRSKAVRTKTADACEIVLASVNLEKLAPEMSEVLAEKLASGHRESIGSQLQAAIAFAYSGKSFRAVDCFQRAQWLAEMQYLRQRKDVAAAVAKERMASGFFHYHHHGRHEGSHWPEQILFEKTCYELLCLFDKDSEARQTIAEVAKVFSETK